MTHRNRFSRFVLFLLTLLALCAGMFSPRVESVEAKPNAAADELKVFISEFRTRGPGGADNEFIEISSLISLAKFITFNSLFRSNNIFSI